MVFWAGGEGALVRDFAFLEVDMVLGVYGILN